MNSFLKKATQKLVTDPEAEVEHGSDVDASLHEKPKHKVDKPKAVNTKGASAQKNVGRKKV
ncbi:MAG: hypothetical protein JNM34_01330 [Chthonomonadaceae bacterium]|nr:hypothetical protein [Chthonomonadaceae bacterium]